MEEFKQAAHTFVISDIHLTDAEPLHARIPLWKKWKRREFFVDDEIQAFTRHAREKLAAGASMELVLNGDIFDFDSVVAIPRTPPFEVNLLERIRGLSAEEAKSRFKLKAILDDHPVFLEALRELLLAPGAHRVVFVIGNHDVELHWPSVREDLMSRLELDPETRERVRFCDWYYISNGDTLIEHGNQYDPYSICPNPIHPMIRHGKRDYVRIPFGNLAHRYMVNGMGLFNPHSHSSYLRVSLAGYLTFYLKYVIRVQPMLVVTWFWSALATLFISVREGLLPAMRDPLTVDARVGEIAERANSTPGVARTLRELHAHPASLNPGLILRELWLDRGLLVAGIFFGTFQLFSFIKLFYALSPWWMLLGIGAPMPLFFRYARSVRSEAREMEGEAFRLAHMSARIAGVQRVVNGHTHFEKHTSTVGVDYLNTGTWSPAFHDVECTQPSGKKCFAWIRPSGEARIAELYEWKRNDAVLLPLEPETTPSVN